ncbi:MAG TPA: hypothetical protein VEI03_05655 [Stellaceae bacterium]|nr:hypothetical protein [Stellaceae bacterium]
MGYASWILALLDLTAAVVFGLVIVYLLGGGIARLMKARSRRRKLLHHG